MLFRPQLAGSILFARPREVRRCERWTTAFAACLATRKPFVTSQRALSTRPDACTLPETPVLSPTLQAIHQSIGQDLERGVEPRGFAEVDLTVVAPSRPVEWDGGDDRGRRYQYPNYGDVQISHLSWYSTPYEEQFSAEWDGGDDVPYDRRGSCGYDPAFPDLPHETFVCMYFTGGSPSSRISSSGTIPNGSLLNCDPGALPIWYYNHNFEAALQGELLKLVASGQLPAEVEIQDSANWESNKYSLDWKDTSFPETGLQSGYHPLFNRIIMILGMW
jgi:hypothetical protein